MRTCYVDKDTRTIADLVAPGELTPGWTITRINVPRAMRGQGHGHKMLCRLLEEADREQVALYLEPSPSGGLGYDELVAWYERHGFVFQPFGYMRRLPQKLTP